MRYTSKFWMFFLLFWVGLGQLQAQTELQPLPVDPKVRYGKLSNGLTYYIRHNELPKDRADFYIAQNVGSILEEENQRGLAHFLEHMAFNGSKTFLIMPWINIPKVSVCGWEKTSMPILLSMKPCI